MPGNTKQVKMQKTEVLDMRLTACRPRFKAGADLSGKVNRIMVTANQTLTEDVECLDIDLKWETEAIKLDHNHAD